MKSYTKKRVERAKRLSEQALLERALAFKKMRLDTTVSNRQELNLMREYLANLQERAHELDVEFVDIPEWRRVRSGLSREIYGVLQRIAKLEISDLRGV